MSDTVFVELIEEKPLDLEGFVAKEVGETRVEPALRTAREYFEGEYRDYLAKFQPYRILITASNGEPLFRSTERYRDERDARHAIDLAFGAGSNVVLQQAGKDDEVLRVATG